MAWGHSLLTKSHTNYSFRDKTGNISYFSQSPFVGQPRAIIWGSEAIVWGAIWEASNKYNVSFDLLYNLAKCESGLSTTVPGDHNLAYGLFQFHLNTFQKNCDGEYRSPRDQAMCCAKMISQGLEDNWTCYHKVMADKL